MNDTTTKNSVAELIDNSAGLKAKGKLLTITSLVFIAIMLTDMQIQEVNSFVFRITIENMSSVPAILLVSILFLTIRYYGYAQPFHAELEQIWIERLLKNPFYLNQNYYSDEPEGVIYDLQPDEFGLGDPSFGYNTKEFNSFSYYRGWLFCRYINYEWYREKSEGR